LFLFPAAAVVLGVIDVYITEPSHVDEGTRIKNIGDALWAMVTITAVGYGSPLSVLLAKKTSQLPVLLSHHVTYTLSPDAAIGAKNSGTNLVCSCALAVSMDCIGVITMIFADNNSSIVLDISNLLMLPLSVLYILIYFIFTSFYYIYIIL
jgi:hypothetical protein